MNNEEKQRADRLSRQRELTAQLIRASKAYYAEDREIMDNRAYDALYDELVQLEKESGIVLPGSPTVNVGYEVVEELPKERHEQPMLSLDKTKSREAFRDWLGDQEGLLSWKLDGLTVVMTYEGGRLVKAVTRGNGEIGEVITPNARTFVNVPQQIPYPGTLILRGEAVIHYSDFEEINRALEEQAAEEGKLSEDVKYKNPRNLCSGSVRQLDSAVTARRRVHFYPFFLVQAGDADFHNSREEQFRFLQGQGFEVVPYRRVNGENILAAIEAYEQEIAGYDVPSDGLVLLLDDIAYGQSLGSTAKFPRWSYAFKWADEMQETTLREVEWSASRTGQLNPVAVFDPVQLEGTTVKRASVHNVSIVRSLKLGIGDRIRVYKANMIIPQIAENLTGSGSLQIPEKCPVCGGETAIRSENDTEVLVCTNPECPAKRIKAFTLFVSRNAMNIDGLSEKSLEKLISEGLIHGFADIYHLSEHREAISAMEGFGELSFEKMTAAIEASRETTAARVVYAIGIPGIGVANARVLCRAFGDDLAALRAADADTLSGIDGIGPVLAAGIVQWFAQEKNAAALDALLLELHITPVVYAQEEEQEGGIAGKTFVITGKVSHFANRDELKEYIIAHGGKATGSVTKKTDYLINNDSQSSSSKNRKAHELGIPILTEEEFLALSGKENGNAD